MADGPSNGNGRVPWVDQAARIITTVGFPVVVAAALLWWVLFRFEAHVDLITSRMEANGQGVAELTDVMRESVTEQRKQTDELREQTAALKAFLDRTKGGR